MLDLLKANIAGFIVGMISSALVAYFFYGLGKSESKKQHLRSQLDSVRLALARCDPTQKGSGRRGDDGLEPTAHWIGCMVDVLKRTGSTNEADALDRVRIDIERLIEVFDSTPEADVHKQQWQAKVAEIV
jgi:hypothetical protein